MKKKFLPKDRTASLVELPAQLVRQSCAPLSSPHLNLIVDGRFHVEIAQDFEADTQERLDGLKQLEIARTGLVRYIEGRSSLWLLMLVPQAQLADLADELHPIVRRQSLIATADMS